MCSSNEQALADESSYSPPIPTGVGSAAVDVSDSPAIARLLASGTIAVWRRAVEDAGEAEGERGMEMGWDADSAAQQGEGSTVEREKERQQDGEGESARVKETQSARGAVGAGYSRDRACEHVFPEEVWVLGTAHTSVRSARDVEAAVAALQPDCVVVELCRSRTALMYAAEAPRGDRASNPFALSGDGGQLRALQRSLALGGAAPLLLRVLLASLSKGVSLDVPIGADFRAAASAARTYNSTLVLGDRPIEITLERCWRALSLDEKAKLVRTAFSALLTPGQARSANASAAPRASEVVDAALDDDDVLQQYESLLAAEYPSLVEPLIRERDIFLSLTMKNSMAVSGTRRVLGIVGRGHQKGVMEALRRQHEPGRFKALTWTPSRAAAKQKVLGVPRPLFTRLSIDAALLAVAWAAAGGYFSAPS